MLVALSASAGGFLSSLLTTPSIVFLSVALPLIIIIYVFVFNGYKGKASSAYSDPTIKAVKESQITAIVIYPIKSCGPIPLQESEYDVYGFKWDRRWMLVTKKGASSTEDDSETESDYKMLSQRQNPKMSLLQPKITSDALVISAPGKKDYTISFQDDKKGERVSVDLWGSDLVGIDEGDKAAEWFSDFLGQECRLVRMPKDHKRDVSAEYAVEGLKNTASFADGFSFLLATNASLNDLNTRLKDPLPMARFRPNIVVSLSPEDYEPWAEDKWSKISLGKDIFYGVKPCSRCKLTTVDPTKGEFGGEEPLATLRTFRKRKRGVVYFGLNLTQEAERGTLKVGDKLKVLATRDDFWGC